VSHDAEKATVFGPSMYSSFQTAASLGSGPDGIWSVLILYFVTRVTGGVNGVTALHLTGGADSLTNRQNRKGADRRQEASMSFADGLKTIVVATDLDGRSEAALEYARKLAAAYGARIVLAHGLDPMDYAAVEAVPGRVLKSLPEQARAVLDRMAGDLLQEGIHSHSEIRQGAVAQMLVMWRGNTRRG